MFRRRSSSDLKLVPLGEQGDVRGSFDPVLVNLLAGSGDDMSQSKLPSLNSLVRGDSGDMVEGELKQQQHHQNAIALLLQQNEQVPLQRRRSSSTHILLHGHQQQPNCSTEQQGYVLPLHRRPSSNDSIGFAAHLALRSRSSTLSNAANSAAAGPPAGAVQAPYNIKTEASPANSEEVLRPAAGAVQQIAGDSGLQSYSSLDNTDTDVGPALSWCLQPSFSGSAFSVSTNSSCSFSAEGSVLTGPVDGAPQPQHQSKQHLLLQLLRDGEISILGASSVQHLSPQQQELLLLNAAPHLGLLQLQQQQQQQQQPVVSGMTRDQWFVRDAPQQQQNLLVTASALMQQQTLHYQYLHPQQMQQQQPIHQQIQQQLQQQMKQQMQQPQLQQPLQQHMQHLDLDEQQRQQGQMPIPHHTEDSQPGLQYPALQQQHEAFQQQLLLQSQTAIPQQLEEQQLDGHPYQQLMETYAMDMQYHQVWGSSPASFSPMKLQGPPTATDHLQILHEQQHLLLPPSHQAPPLPQAIEQPLTDQQQHQLLHQQLQHQQLHDSFSPPLLQQVLEPSQQQQQHEDEKQQQQQRQPQQRPVQQQMPSGSPLLSTSTTSSRRSAAVHTPGHRLGLRRFPRPKKIFSAEETLKMPGIQWNAGDEWLPSTPRWSERRYGGPPTVVSPACASPPLGLEETNSTSFSLLIPSDVKKQVPHSAPASPVMSAAPDMKMDDMQQQEETPVSVATCTGSTKSDGARGSGEAPRASISPSQRQVPELTKGAKCVRGAPRATVQQLYGQTYDLEALALQLDQTHIDEIDPGDFDRAYHQGKRYAVGDLGRKLLLIVVREKLEAGACGQLKFLTLTDLFRLAHELGLWEFALKVAMAYKAGSLRIPKGVPSPHQSNSSSAQSAHGDKHWLAAPSSSSGHSISSAAMHQDWEEEEIRFPRSSKRRLQLMAAGSDSGNCIRRSRSQHSGDTEESLFCARSGSADLLKGVRSLLTQDE